MVFAQSIIKQLSSSVRRITSIQGTAPTYKFIFLLWELFNTIFDGGKFDGFDGHMAIHQNITHQFFN